MDVLKYVNTSISTAAHVTAHATHPHTHTIPSIHISIFHGGAK